MVLIMSMRFSLILSLPAFSAITLSPESIQSSPRRLSHKKRPPKGDLFYVVEAAEIEKLF